MDRQTLVDNIVGVAKTGLAPVLSPGLRNVQNRVTLGLVIALYECHGAVLKTVFLFCHGSILRRRLPASQEPHLTRNAMPAPHLKTCTRSATAVATPRKSMRPNAWINLRCITFVSHRLFTGARLDARVLQIAIIDKGFVWWPGQESNLRPSR
jgi:hypothetical protein